MDAIPLPVDFQNSLSLKGELASDLISKKPLKVCILTTRARILGEMHIQDGYRLKDELDNLAIPTVAVTNARVTLAPDTPGGKDMEATFEFLAVAKAQIVFCGPIKQAPKKGSS